LGRYGEVGRELSRRVEAGADDVGSGRVLATLAGESLTDADLDRMVEHRVDQMLQMQAADGDEATRQMLLKQFSAASMRQQLLLDLLRRELFTRRARELELDQDEAFVRARQTLADDLLAQRFEQREMAKIQPTAVDLQSYFEANKEQYREPESLEVVFFELKPKEKADEVLQDVKSADDFLQLVAERQSDAPEESQKPPRETVVRDRAHPQLGDVESLFDIGADQWTKQPHENADRRFLVLVTDRTPERLPEFAEVEQQVEREYRSRKRQELMEQLFRDLMTRYEVEIESQPAESDESSEESGTDDSRP
jgi:peptidyl-prolyl cis-trans isomerase C